MGADSSLRPPLIRVLKAPFPLRRGGVVAVKNNWEVVVAGLDVVAEDGLADVLMVVASSLLDTGIVRVRSLAQEYRAASHSNHRRKSPWTELASQSTRNGFCC